MSNFENQLELAKAKLGIEYSLKEEQTRALKSVYDGNDTLCLLRTGFGKSIIYQLTPFLMENKVPGAVTIIVTPLNSIMQDQVRKMAQGGIKACYLDMKCLSGETYAFREIPKDARSDLDDSSDEMDPSTEDHDVDDQPPPGELKVSVPLDEIISGGYQLIYTHPEALLTAPQGKALMRNPVFRQKICCIAIDEAHMIAEWGDSFRPDFSRLQDLLALCTKVPALVMTATASVSTKELIISDLGLQNPTCITVNPDRPNIMYTKIERSPATRQFDDLDQILSSIATGLKESGLEYPITILYTNCENIAYCYRYMQTAMKGHEYVGESIPENILFGMYHQTYCPKVKEHIVSELAKPNSRVRFVIATVALGMGLDAPGIRKVIHFGSPTSIEKYLQETGRAGRDGQPADAVLYYNATDIRKNKPGQTVSMTQFCKVTDGCLREVLLDHLSYSLPDTRLLCRCCSFCKGLCDCPQCTHNQP